MIYLFTLGAVAPPCGLLSRKNVGSVDGPTIHCHSQNVTLFRFTLQRGTPIVDQVVFASIRAISRGEYRPEQPFPSVRAIASSLKIHPNTAHKAIQTLIERHWLEVRSGLGTTVVASPPKSHGGDRKSVQPDIDRLAVKARANSLSLADVTDELQRRWKRFDATKHD